MGFPDAVSEEALLSCGRRCCICHKFCGPKIELHHIKQKADGGEDTFENCIPLCFDCHAEVKAYNPNHPKGKSYSDSELIQHRDRWYSKVKNYTFISSNENQIDLDKELFTHLVDLLNKNSFIDSIRKHIFSEGLFSYSVFDAVDEFCYKWGGPEYEFLDLDLEFCRANLYDLIKKFSYVIGVSTFPCGNNTGSIPEEWEYEQPERFTEAVNKIDNLSDQIFFEYSNLIHLGMQKLGIRIIK